MPISLKVRIKSNKCSFFLFLFFFHFSQYSSIHFSLEAGSKMFVNFWCCVSPHCQCGTILRGGSLVRIQAKFWRGSLHSSEKNLEQSQEDATTDR